MNRFAIAFGAALLAISSIAEAQWAMVARRAMGRVEQMSQQSQQPGGASYDSGIGVFREIARQAEINPAGSAAIPLFPPALTNHQVMVFSLSTPTPGPISGPVPNYVQMNGSLAEDRLFFASEQRVFDNVVDRFNNYTPFVTARDVSCSLAGVMPPSTWRSRWMRHQSSRSSASKLPPPKRLSARGMTL